MLISTGGILMALMAATTQYPLEPLPLPSVHAGGEFGRRIGVTIDNNLLVMDIEKDFLAPFQRRSAESGYVGTGKLIDAMAHLSANTGDERLIQRKRDTVAAILATQEPDGYIGLMKPQARVAQLWDVHEMSYLVLGLTNDYALCGEKASLEGARRLADYLLAHLGTTPRPVLGDGQLSKTMPDTGFEESLLALYQQTGDARYCDFARDYRPLTAWHEPIAVGRWGHIEGHAYAYIDKCLSQLRLNRLEPNGDLLAPTRGVFEFLLQKDGLVITGTCGDHECWHDTQAGTTNLGETCTTAYLIRFCDELLRKTGNTLFADVIERAVYNALFAAQSPDGRHIRYYTPFEAPRVYFEADTYCCPCNYRRILAELPAMIYYHRDAGAAISLYTTSSAHIPLENGVELTLAQETDYPNSGEVLVHVDPSKPATFPLAFRIPRWCKKAEIRVNGEGVTPTMDAFTAIEREWKPGDTVKLSLDMPCRFVKGRRAQAGRAAVMRGPQLFALNPAHNPSVEKFEPRLLTLDLSFAETAADATVRPDGTACRVHVWNPAVWYDQAKPHDIVLTEYPDPEATSVYFHVPNPNDPRLEDDELIGMPAFD